MGVDHSYYKDFESANGKSWYRWIIIDRFANPYTPVDAPEWGDDPGVSSTYVKIPDFVLLETTEESEYSYDTIPVGMPTKTGHTIRVNLSELAKAAGGSDLEYLHTMLKDRSSVTGTLAGVYGAPSFELGIQWILLKGDKGDNIADFTVEFHGIQIHDGERDWGDLVPGERAVVEYEISDIADYILKTCKMAWVCDDYVQNAGTLSTGHDRAYLRAWNDTHTNAWILSSSESANTLTFGYWYNFYLFMQQVLNEMYQLLTRQTVTTSTDNLEVKSVKSTTGVDRAGMPRDYRYPYKQSYNKDGSAGSVITDRSNWLFLAWLEHSTEGPVAGAVLQDRDGSWYDVESVWEWLHTECKNEPSGVRGEYRYESMTNLQLWFYPLGQGHQSTTITRSDVEEIQGINQGKYAFRQIKLSRPQTEELDVKEHIEQGDPKGKAKWGVSLLTETVVPNGGKDDFEDVVDITDDFPSGSQSFGLRGWPLMAYRMTYYLDPKSAVDIGAGSEQVPFAVHHDARIYHTYDTDLTEYSEALPEDLPTPALAPFVFRDHIRTGFRDLVRPLNVEMMKSAGLAVWIGQEMMAQLGSGDATMYELTLKKKDIGFGALGDELKIGPDGSGNYTAGALLDVSGDDSADDVPGIGRIVSVTPHMDETVTVKMFAVASS